MTVAGFEERTRKREPGNGKREGGAENQDVKRAGGHPHGSGGNGAAPVELEAPASVETAKPTPATNGSQGTLRFFLHESDDHDADRERLDALIALIEQHPGPDAMRIFIHGHDGDKIELTLPDGAASEQLRSAGIEILGSGGGADPLKTARTRGIEAVEVV